MPESKPIPLRLEDAVIARLDKAANKLGLRRAALIRALVETYLGWVETTGETVLPPRWTEITRQFDGRRSDPTPLPPRLVIQRHYPAASDTVPALNESAETKANSPAAAKVVEAAIEKGTHYRTRKRRQH